METAWRGEDRTFPHYVIVVAAAAASNRAGSRARQAKRRRQLSVTLSGRRTPESCAVCAPDSTAMLRDVHTALGLQNRSSGGGEEASSSLLFVRGSYEYHHYGQEVSDHGWGCAYRSCQTIFSWYKLQCPDRVGRVPSIEDMQRQLVLIGDKPASFLHGTEWIGSVEIMLLLESMHGISCKIVNTRNGCGLDRAASHQIAEHMRTVGSPIMVGGNGGGARAIIGIELSESRSPPGGHDILRFLVLDPHYPGQDTLESLRQHLRQVCVWVTPVELFRQYGRFTNFCLPLQLSEACVAPPHAPGREAAGGAGDNWELEVIDSS